MQNSPNQFGIEEIPQILQIEDISQIIHDLLKNVLLSLEVNDDEAEKLTKTCLSIAQKTKSVIDYEAAAHELFKDIELEPQIRSKLVNRAHLIKNQVLPHLLPGILLDLGCGDGQVGKLLSYEGFRVQLTDTNYRPNALETGLMYTMQNEGEQLIDIEDNKFDNVLLSVVLHHSDDPDFLLREAQRVVKPGGRVILIESVYGVGNNPEFKDAEFFTKLSTIQQRFSNVFFDHFYNRVLHFSDDTKKKVNVPCNFDTPEGWKKRIQAAGLTQKQLIHLGLDHEIVPEWHTLHVLTKK